MTGPVLAAERQGHILDEVQRRGAIRVSELSQLLGVSDMTIRRDLDTLAGQGQLDKVHGGATVRRAPSTDEPGFEAKGQRQVEEKEAIAAAALAMVTPGSAIGLSAGTTTWMFARHLVDVPDLTVVTNSMRIADLLHASPTNGPNVVLTGGVRTPSDALVGPLAVSALEQLHLDVVFMGVHGMDPKAGFTTPNLLEAETDRALVDAGRRFVVLADHTKWGTVGIKTIASIEQADTIVVDSHMAGEDLTALRELAQDVVVAEVSAHPAPAP
nr:DeoR/GlpR family DNA-binding transcription regulator [Ornithinimicrobium sp. HY1745]